MRRSDVIKPRYTAMLEVHLLKAESELKCGNLIILLRQGYSQTVYIDRLVYSSTRNSLQTYVSLRRYTAAA